MPELPEVETTRQGIEPHLRGRAVTDVVVRQPRLRWPVPRCLRSELVGQTITGVGRRAKYLLISTEAGELIVHLGMSGHLRIVDSALPAGAHDHVDILLAGGNALRLNDPRRFGSILWTKEDPAQHVLLKDLGPEPLARTFDGRLLYLRSRGRRATVKTFIMDSRVVAGVGNIYANESLFVAGIHPTRAAGRISRQRYGILAAAIKTVLSRAIEAGGTTLRDFVGEGGQPGYFQHELRVYGRVGGGCSRCGAAIKHCVHAQRSTYYCGRCQH